MNVRGLADWIDQNYPGLSPYLEVVGSPWEQIEVYLDRELRTSDLLGVVLSYDSYEDRWEYSGADIIDKKRMKDLMGRYMTRKDQTIDDFLDKMSLICDVCVEIINWYEQFPIETDRARLIELGMQRISGWSNSFFEKFPDSGIEVHVDLPGADARDYVAELSGRHTCVEIHASTLDELLNKIIAGEE